MTVSVDMTCRIQRNLIFSDGYGDEILQTKIVLIVNYVPEQVCTKTWILKQLVIKISRLKSLVK